MDYYKLGQRIRKYRKAQNLSQEALAEKAGISVTHMSHIETGNTKLSLAVFVKIAEILEVQTDDLLYDITQERPAAIQEINALLTSCDSSQIHILTDIIKASKIALDKYK